MKHWEVKSIVISRFGHIGHMSDEEWIKVSKEGFMDVVVDVGEKESDAATGFYASPEIGEYNAVDLIYDDKGELKEIAAKDSPKFVLHERTREALEAHIDEIVAYCSKRANDPANPSKFDDYMKMVRELRRFFAWEDDYHYPDKSIFL